MKLRIRKNCLYLNNRKIFESNSDIHEFLKMDNFIAVITKEPIFQSVSVIDTNGNVIWNQMDLSDIDLKEPDKDKCVGIYPNDETTFKVFTFFCYRYLVDIATGKVIDAVFTK